MGGRNRARLTTARLEQLALSSANIIKFEKALPGLGFFDDGPEDEFVADCDSGGQDGAGADEQNEEEEELEESGDRGE
jgi:hypothetical protein